MKLAYIVLAILAGTILGCKTNVDLVASDDSTVKTIDTISNSDPPRLVKLEVTNPESSKTKLLIHVEGKGIETGSFFIRMDEGRPPDTNEFYKSENGFWYINGGSIEHPTPNVPDGSNLDEDNRKGFFSYTFKNMSNWPDSLYGYTWGWHNRPQTGIYKSLTSNGILLNGKPYTFEQSNIPGISHSVIYMKNGEYAAFPDLFIIDNAYAIGASFGVRTQSREHIDPRSVGHSLISQDGGITWEKSRRPQVDTRWETKKGTLVIPKAKGWVYVDATQEEELKRQQRIVVPSTDGRIAYLGGALSRYSMDNGETWQNRELTIPDNCSGLMNHHSSASYITTSSDIRIRAVYGRRKKNADNTNKDEIYLIRSADDGNTWKVFPMFKDGISNLEVTGFNETSLVEANDGTLIALMRSVPAGSLWQSESKDDGLTWGTPTKTPMEGYPASAIKLKDGRLFTAYGRRKAPMGIRAVVSNDNGKTWNIKKELIIRADGLGNPSDLGYPVVYELPDTSIFCLYYLTIDNVNTHIARSIFKIPY